MKGNPVALITGSSRGIGRGIALALASAGYDTVINYAGNEDAARQTAADCESAGRGHGGVRAHVVRADIGNTADRDAMLAFVRERCGRLDLLVNNAGITSIGRADVLEATEENFDRLMAVNLKGPYFLSQQAGKWMIEQVTKDAERRPKIVTITSVSAYAVSTNRGDYCVAKAGLRMMTRLYAVRLAESGIGVYEVCPGIIESDMTAPVQAKYDRLIRDGLTPIRRWGTPDDVGRAVCAIASGAFAFSTGEVINVDGGFHLRTL